MIVSNVIVITTLIIIIDPASGETSSVGHARFSSLGLGFKGLGPPDVRVWMLRLEAVGTGNCTFAA